MPPLLLQSFLFSSLLFCYCSYLICYTCFSPNALKGKGCIFFLSLLCLPYKCRNEHYIWNIFRRTLWFTVLHLCKHFVFSPAGNQLSLLDLLFLFSLSQSWDGCFWKHLLHTHLFLQSHITPGLILTAFCKQLLGATEDFFLLSLWGEWGFHLRTAPGFWSNPKAVSATTREGARGCVAPCPFSDSGCKTTLRRLMVWSAQSGTSPGRLGGAGPPDPHRSVKQPQQMFIPRVSLDVSWTYW